MPKKRIENWIWSEDMRKGKAGTMGSLNGVGQMEACSGKEQDGYEDLFLFVPEKRQIVRISEGTGDNLLWEDRFGKITAHLQQYSRCAAVKRKAVGESGGMSIRRLLLGTAIPQGRPGLHVHIHTAGRWFLQHSSFGSGKTGVLHPAHPLRIISCIRKALALPGFRQRTDAFRKL